jgi:hypothetical protein
MKQPKVGNKKMKPSTQNPQIKKSASSQNGTPKAKTPAKLSKPKGRGQDKTKFPEMKIISSAAQSSALTSDDSFEALLQQQKERQQAAPLGRQIQPTGELETSWKLEKSKKGKTGADETLEGKRRPSSERRSASKNTFRKMIR